MFRFALQILVFGAFILSLSMSAFAQTETGGLHSSIKLTKEEEAWIKAHPQIVLGTDKSWSPQVIPNPDGSIGGIEADILERINGLTGLNLQITLGQWKEIQERAKRKEIDGLATATYQKAREPYFLFSDSPYSMHKYIFSRHSDLGLVQDMNSLAGKRLAYIRGNLFDEKILARHPDIKGVPQNSHPDSLEALIRGEVDAVMGGLNFQYLLRERIMTEVGLALIVPDSELKLLYCIRKDWPELHAIMNKALAAIPIQERLAIVERHSGVAQRAPPPKEIQLTKEEKAWLHKHQTIKVHMESGYAPFSYIDHDKFVGYSIDYADLIASTLGVKFEYKQKVPWSQAIDDLKGRKIDVIAQMINSEARQKFTLFTEGYYTYYQGIVARRDRGEYTVLNQLYGMTVGVVQGYYTEDVIREHHKPIIIKIYPDNMDLLDAVVKGKVDAAVTTHQIMQHNITQLFLKDIVVSRPLFNDPHLSKTEEAFGVRKDWPLLRSAIQKAIDATLVERLNTQRKWFGGQLLITEKEAPIIEFTAAEKSYLTEKGTIRMCIDPNWMPFEKIDANGKHIGMSDDILELLQQRSGIALELVPTRSWSESIEFAKTRKCDILSLAMETPERKKYMDFTTPYLTFPFVIATRTEEIFVENLESVLDKTLVMVKGYAYVEILKSRYPDIKIIEANNVLEGLMLVRKGDAYGYIDTLATIAYTIQKEGMVDIKIAGKLKDNWELGIGTRNDESLLNTVFEKALSTVSEIEKQHIYNNWFSVTMEQEPDYSLIWKIVLASVLIMAGIVYWNRRLAILNVKIKQAKEEAEEAETKFRSLVESSQTVPFTFDLNLGRYTYIGPQVEEWLGYPPESWTDLESWANRIHHEDRERTVNACLEDTAEGRDHVLEFRMITADGRIIWNREVISVVSGATGPEKLHGFMFDITEHKRAEEEIQAAKDQAEAANKSKSAFLASMSHELRTPLNAVLGFSQMMHADKTLTVQQRANLDIINSSGNHLLHLINDVLDMSKIEAGKLGLMPEDIDLGDLVRDVIEMLQVRAEQKGLQLIYDQASDVPRFVRADGPKIRQILINLLSNAIKFTDSGGVTLRFEAKKDGPESIILHGEVQDTGRGISSEDIERIFQPFEQLTAAVEQRGTGLGLAITRQFVELMNGDISAASQPGKGTTFTFRIQVEPGNPDHVHAAGIAEMHRVIGLQEPAKEWRILIVEDQRENQLLLQQLLETAGFKVRIAQDGKQGVEAFHEWHPHFIWMDRRMPNMDGLEATRRIRELPGGDEVKISALTASVFNEQKDEVMEAGCDDFVSKPYRPEEIFDCMARHLDLQYRYEEEEAAAEAETIGITSITPERIEALPEELLQALDDAVTRLKPELIHEVLKQVAEIDADLATALGNLADTYDFKAIKRHLTH